MTDKLKEKLKLLPNSSGIYYHLDQAGKIIYVGKAANLKNRVRQYFNNPASLRLSPKDVQLRSQIKDIDWRLTDNSLQALYLESEMIKRYQPKYNVLNRNSSFSNWYYLAFNFSKDNPHLILTRNILEDESYLHIGPFIDGQILKRILKYLRKSFPYSNHKTLPQKACLDYHLNLCPGPETLDFNSKLALENLRNLALALRGQQVRLIKELTLKMQQASKVLEFEQASRYRNQIQALRSFKQSLIFKDLNLVSRSDQALEDLRQLFYLKHTLHRIETYDISHISGSHITASMIVAEFGILQPALSRRFKSTLKVGNNDFAHIEDILKRRFKMSSLKDCLPDLIIIDGGKGQVGAVYKALEFSKLNISVIGIAKKKEQIIFKNKALRLNEAKLAELKGGFIKTDSFTTLNIPLNSHIVQFVQRLRDASHRKAVSYHNYLRSKSSLESDLLNLPSIGRVTYTKLIKKFGSLANIKKASDEHLKTILNDRQFKIIKKYFNL